MKLNVKKSFRCKNLIKRSITVLVIFFFAITQQVLGQMSDDFADGDFILNPSWSGSTNNFIVNTFKQLQLNQSVAGTSYLSTPFETQMEIVEWQFYVGQTFSGSATNYGRIYLTSSQPNLTGALNGYYLQFGEAGSNDAIELFRQTGSTSTSVCRADNGGIANSFGVRMKVTRSNEGVWTIFIDYAGGTNFVSQATGTDITHTSSAHFGVRCTYTVTNANRFFYDDISIATFSAPDVIAPLVSGLTVNSSRDISVLFSEPIDPLTAENELNYSITNENNHPVSAILEPDGKTVKLLASSDFVNGANQSLIVRNVKDVAGNTMTIGHVAFLYFQPTMSSRKDIVISEILADPSPVIGLPEAEYIEIFNRSSHPFNLLGWHITDGTSKGNLSSEIILPGEYLVITSKGALTHFLTIGRAIAASAMPSLNNSSDVIKLISPEGITIDSVSYTTEWYRDDEKKDGGWALEIIDPHNICKDSSNWTVSTNVKGGTPGEQNDVYFSIPDITGPKLIAAEILNSKRIKLEFDEKLNAILPLPANFVIQPWQEVLSVSFSDKSLSKIDVQIAGDLDSTQTHTFKLFNIYDCGGNKIQDTNSTISFKLDSTPPSLISVNVLSSTTLELLFSEKLKIADAENLKNYEVLSDHPIVATLQDDLKTVKLQFANHFVNGEENRIAVKNIADLGGNFKQIQETKFLFFIKVHAFIKDVVFSEIFADPSPPEQLPEVEFIELYNRSNNPFDLEGWKISDGTTTASLPRFIMLPKTYLIICAPSQASHFTTFGKVMGVTSFPSLNNTGESLTVKDNLGTMVDSVKYDMEWYKDDEKKDGGWSLEIIDPDNICSESENWIASENSSGGTPGKINSVFANKPDLTGPKLLSVFPLSETTLLLKFDEKLEKTLPALENFVLEPSITISGMSLSDKTLTSIYLQLTESLQGGIQYKLSVQKIYDCAGNALQNEFGTSTFALPEKADGNDIVINEILFNPKSPGVDFVEIYNRSEKFINLKNWKIANFENAAPVNAEVIINNDFLFEPHAYLVLTEDGNILKGEYLQAKEEAFLEIDLPSFPDDEGSVALVNNEDAIIDAFVYSDSYHSLLLKDEEGVSLERISFSAGTVEKENWKSASSVSGFATPGYLNSNSIEISTTAQHIEVEPEIFIPQNGQPDFAQIKYNFERGGYLANVKILDPQGREIKRLANNELLGIDGFFRWDGDQDNGSKARIGSYMVWFEVFDVGGEVRTFRKRVVIADKF